MRSSTTLRCLHTCFILGVVLVSLQLLLTTDAKTLKSGRGKGKGNHNNMNQIRRGRDPGNQRNPTYPIPNLASGNSFEHGRHNNRHGHRQNNQNYRNRHNQHTHSQQYHQNIQYNHDHLNYQQHQQYNPAMMGGGGFSLLQDTPPHRDELSPDEIASEDDFEWRKQLRINTIKDHVLGELHLGSTPPNMTGVVESKNPSIQRLIQAVMNSMNPTQERRDEEYPQDVPQEAFDDYNKTFVPVEETTPHGYLVPKGQTVMYFKMNKGKIKKAVLHLWIRPVPTFVSDEILLTMYEVQRPRSDGDLIMMTHMFDYPEKVSPDHGHWIEIPIFALVNNWVKKSEDNLCMVVEMIDKKRNTQIPVTGASEMPGYAPLLEVQYVEESRKNRSERSPQGDFCNPRENRCCRFNLEINFDHQGFDFIVAPKVYLANFCHGKCTYLFAQQHVHNAVIQKLHNSTANSGPCCGGREMLPLNMLYYDHEAKIRFDTINDMIVEVCSCD